LKHAPLALRAQSCQKQVGLGNYWEKGRPAKRRTPGNGKEKGKLREKKNSAGGSLGARQQTKKRTARGLERKGIRLQKKTGFTRMLQKTGNVVTCREVTIKGKLRKRKKKLWEKKTEPSRDDGPAGKDKSRAVEKGADVPGGKTTKKKKAGQGGGGQSTTAYPRRTSNATNRCHDKRKRGKRQKPKPVRRQETTA